MRRDSQEIRRILERHEWEDVELSREMLASHEDVLRNLDDKVEALRHDQKTAGEKADRLVFDRRPELEETWANLRMNELFHRMQSYFGRTARTAVISGWVPASRKASLESGLRKAAGGRCYLEWREPESGSERETGRVPVLMSTPRILAPFRMIVTGYAIPEYGTIDPTPFVAVCYLLMFGLMFGDAGHGLVLILIGLLGLAHFRDGAEGPRTLMQLVVWCGGAAVVFGVLFGSYFGWSWLPPVWFDLHGVVRGHAVTGGFVRSIYDVLRITIYFGIAVIGVGLLLNWFNLVFKGQWMSLLFDKGGVLGGWIYGAGIYVAFAFVRHDYKQLPDAAVLFWLLGLPALLLLVKPALTLVSDQRGGTGGGVVLRLMNAGMEWLVELLEIFSGYLANTLSFMRVAGLGIAHVSLMTAFFEMARMAASADGYTLWSVLILVLGNALVIVLEGLSAGIQSLRLNYYEFFSKYFRGNGRPYLPISLRSR
jgi:V/A-type H+-transporting ATPase subunit I